MSEILDLELLPRGTLAALEKAVRAATEWRGAYAGDPDALSAFDADLRAMRQALRDLKRQQKALRFLLRHVTNVREAAAVVH